jgi:hypothetical protein
MTFTQWYVRLILITAAIFSFVCTVFLLVGSAQDKAVINPPTEEIPTCKTYYIEQPEFKCGEDE